MERARVLTATYPIGALNEILDETPQGVPREHIILGPLSTSESASRPLVGFGELNDTTIKGLTILLSI